MSGLLIFDAFAVLFFLVGFHLAFRPNFVFGIWARRRRADEAQPAVVSEDVASALRIGGVMVMAFSVTICVFANLIAYYSVHSLNG